MTLAVPVAGWLVESATGQRATAVPVTRCGACGLDMPADHHCPQTRQAAPVAPETAQLERNTTRERS